MDEGELRLLLGKTSTQLNKKLESIGYASTVVPGQARRGGDQSDWEITCLTVKGLYSLSYKYLKTTDEHMLFMRFPPEGSAYAYVRTPTNQTPLVSARKLATTIFNHIVDNESETSGDYDETDDDSDSKMESFAEPEEDISFDSNLDYDFDFSDYADGVRE